MKITFLPDNITMEAQAGELILDVAERAEIFIPTGCLMGSCHACEVTLEDGTPVCACITGLPRNKEHLTINLAADFSW